MAKLIFFGIMSLDGYFEDADGGIDFGRPDDEVSGFATELERSIGTSLYGRRLYETMLYWDTLEDLASLPSHVREFKELWREGDKIVFSTTLEDVAAPNTRLEREFDPVKIQEMKSALDRDISIGGPNLAAHAFRAGLVDECHLFVVPVVLGGGKPALPTKDRVELELLGEHRFRSGFVYLRYRTKPLVPTI